MPDSKTCLANMLKPDIQKALFGDRQMPKEAIKRVAEDIESLKKHFDKNGDMNGFKRKVREYIKEQRELSELEVRTRAGNILRANRMHDFLLQPGFEKDRAEGFKAILEKSTTLANGGSYSLVYQARSRFNKYMDHVAGRFEKDGLDKYVVSGLNDGEIRKAESLLAAGRSVDGVSPEALKVAQILKDHYDLVFQDKRDANIPVRRLFGYAGPQVHDARLVGADSFENWKATILPELDTERTFGAKFGDDAHVDKVLKQTYKEIKAGVYGQDKSIGIPDEQITDLLRIGPARNIEKKLSESRTLHFKDGEGYHRYSEKYGAGVAESLVNDMRYTSHQLAILNTFGTNPEAGFQADFERVTHTLRERGDIDAVKRLEAQQDRLTSMFRQATSIDHTVGNNMIAKTGAGIRALQAASKLGLVAFRSFANVAGAAVALKNAQGENIMQVATKLSTEWASQVPEGVRATFAKRFSNFIQDEQSSLLENFSRGRMDGAANRAARYLTKYGGLEFMNNTTSFAVGKMQMESLADTIGKSFETLPNEKQVFFLEAGFKPEEYKLLSKAVETGEDGRTLLTPEGFSKIDDGDLKAAMKETGVKNTSVGAYRTDLEMKYRSALLQISDIATTTAGVREGSRLNMGTKLGTVEGEFLRLITQFKSFTLQSINISRKFLNSQANGELLEKGVLQSEGRDMTSFAQFLAGTTVAAVAANAAIAKLTGRKVQDPTKASTWLDAMGKSGVGGMHVDFLVGEWDKYNGAEAVLGPTFGALAGSGLETFSLARNEALEGRDPFTNKVLRDSAKLVRSNIPFQNFPGIKQGLDYLQYDVVNEALNPGSKARYNLRKARQEAQGE